MTLGQKLQTMRKEAGMSQETLASKLYVTRQSVSQWENDKATPSVDLLIKLSQIFGTTVDSLLGNDDSESEEKPSAEAEVVSGFGNNLKAMSCLFRSAVNSCIGAAIGAAYFGALVYATYLEAFTPDIFKEHSNQSSHPIWFIISALCLAAALALFVIRIIKARKSAEFTKSRAYRLEFFRGKLVITPAEGEATALYYSNVRRITESDGYWLLHMKNGVILCVDKRRIDGDTRELEAILRNGSNYSRRRYSKETVSELKSNVLCAIKDISFSFLFFLIPSVIFFFALSHVTDVSGIAGILLPFLPFLLCLPALIFSIVQTAGKNRSLRLIICSGAVAAVCAVMALASVFTLPCYRFQHDRVTPAQFTEAMREHGLKVENTIVGRQEYFITDCLTASPENGSFEILYLNFDQTAHNDALRSAYSCYMDYMVKINSTPRTSTKNTYLNLTLNAFYTELTNNRYAYVSYNKYTVIFVQTSDSKAEEVQEALGALEEYCHQSHN